MVIQTGVIFYRFGSERGIWRELKVGTIGGLLVSDLKIMVAQETSLSKDFTRKTNLTVSLYDEHSTEAPKPLEDNIMVHMGSRVIINRVAWAPVKPIYHEAKTKFEGEVVEEKKKLPEFPRSFICNLCGLPLNDAVLVKCSANCGYSGCRQCVISALKDFIIKNEEQQEPVLYTLSERQNCPFCRRGLVTAFVVNRKIKALLDTLDFRNFEIPEIDIAKNDTKVVFAPASWDSYQDIPKYYVMCIDFSLIDTIRQNMMLPVYIDSQISARLHCYQYARSNDATVPASMGEVFVIVLSYVGGGSSISPMGMVKLGEEVQYNMDFIKQTRAHKAYKFEWIHENKAPIMLPARRQPLFSYLGGKRCTSITLNSKEDVMWRYRNDLMIEVGLKQEKFEALFTVIFGLKSDVLNKESCVQSKNWLEAAYPGGPAPMYITQKCEVKTQDEKVEGDVVDDGNPYLGYLALLPFLSKSQFLTIREAQRRSKEEFLSQFTHAVTASLPKDKGEPVLERAYNNVWKRHIEYNFPPEDNMQ